MQNKRLLFHTDNQAVVSILNNKTSKDPIIMILVRHLVLSCLKYNIMFRGKWIAGLSNPICDALSRSQMEKFRQLMPLADVTGAEIPAEFKEFCQN